MRLPIIIVCFLTSSLFAQDLVGVNDLPQPASQSATTRPAPRRAAKRNPPNIVDKLVQIDSVDTFSDGSLRNTRIIPELPARIELGYKQSDFPRTGTWTSDETRTSFPFINLIASFNVATPPETGVTLETRVEQDGKWSPWIPMQSWGKTLTPLDQPLKWDAGALDTDELVLTKSAEKFQTRLTLTSFNFDQNITPAVRRLSVCYSGIVADPEERKHFAPATNPTNWARDLKVPFRGQGAESNPQPIRGMICSPTSVSMVLHYYSFDRTTVENAMAIYDPYHDLFGNWGRAISRASEFVLDAWLARFRDWDHVKVEIAAGHPVIASIRFAPGEARGLLYNSTAGHLIVIRGFKENGDVIVNDPASKDKGNGVVYPAAELARAWFDNGGVGYVIHGPPSSNSLAKTPPTTAPATRPTAYSSPRRGEAG